MIDLAQDLTRTPIDVLNVNLLFIPFFSPIFNTNFFYFKRQFNFELI